MFRNDTDEVEFVIDAKRAVTELVIHGGGNDQKAFRRGIAKWVFGKCGEESVSLYPNGEPTDLATV